MQTEELLSACRTPTPNTPITIEFKYQSRRELLDELYWIGAKFIKFPGLQEAGEGMSPHCLIKAQLEKPSSPKPHKPPPLQTGVFNIRAVCATYLRSRFLLKSNFPLSFSCRFQGTYLQGRERAGEVKDEVRDAQRENLRPCYSFLCLVPQ